MFAQDLSKLSSHLVAQVIKDATEVLVRRGDTKLAYDTLAGEKEDIEISRLRGRDIDRELSDRHAEFAQGAPLPTNVHHLHAI